MPESQGSPREGEQRGRVRRRPASFTEKDRWFALGAPPIALLVSLLSASAQAQTAPTSPPPVAAPSTAPAAVPIEPLTTGPVNAAPTLAEPGPLLAPAPAPAAPADAPPVTMAASPPHEPFYQKWWFWTAVGAVTVTTVAIIIATSGSDPPHTDFGNMPAF